MEKCRFEAILVKQRDLINSYLAKLNRALVPVSNAKPNVVSHRNLFVCVHNL